MRWDFVRHLRNASKISCVISMQMNQKELSSHIGEERRQPAFRFILLLRERVSTNPRRTSRGCRHYYRKHRHRCGTGRARRAGEGRLEKGATQKKGAPKGRKAAKSKAKAAPKKEAGGANFWRKRLMQLAEGSRSTQ